MAASTQYDVIVVGGGIAGSCLAGVLAREGLGVLLLDAVGAPVLVPLAHLVRGEEERGPAHPPLQPIASSQPIAVSYFAR